MNDLAKQLEKAAASVREQSSDFVPVVGVVLGSGLGGLVDGMEISASIPYDQIPGFPRSTVEGHAGRLVLGFLGGTSVAVMQGRVHLYEGYSPAEVAFPVRVLITLGAKKLVITNAAGGINPTFEEKELMLITDQINLTGQNPLVGFNDPGLGLRFPDMTHAYDPELREAALRVARKQDLRLREGVYVGLLGPTYETPAEIRMLARMGGDAVGMSTVFEVIAARHLGARVVGFSCISNKAAGLAPGPLSHEEVFEAGVAVQDELIRLVTGTLEAIASL